MKFFNILALTIMLNFKTNTLIAASFYDCSLPRPEMAGFHNMVLFGTPDDKLYVYHLPLFAGNVNGTSGHVLMHVYQGLWNVKLDDSTKSAYDLKFSMEKTAINPFPFFTIGPKENRFKVPEMICNPNFSLKALVTYGHIEGNPQFPEPVQLINQLSMIRVQGNTILARRFDGTVRSTLTYFIFGTSKQYYMVHFLTDDENSFDQIVAVEINDPSFKDAIEKRGGIVVNIPIIPENDLVLLNENVKQNSPNNKWKLPTATLGKTILVTDTESSVPIQVKVMGEVYFNNNEDLKK